MTTRTSCATWTAGGSIRLTTSEVWTRSAEGSGADDEVERPLDRVGVLAGRREVVDPDEVEPQGPQSDQREDRGVATLPARRGAGVEVAGVDHPGDERPHLLRVPVPVARPRLVRPDRTGDEHREGPHWEGARMHPVGELDAAVQAEVHHGDDERARERELVHVAPRHAVGLRGHPAADQRDQMGTGGDARDEEAEPAEEGDPLARRTTSGPRALGLAIVSRALS